LDVTEALLQLPAGNHNPSCDGTCTRAPDAEEKKEYVKREFGRQSADKGNAERHIS